MQIELVDGPLAGTYHELEVVPGLPPGFMPNAIGLCNEEKTERYYYKIDTEYEIKNYRVVPRRSCGSYVRTESLIKKDKV